jgi:EAL domain-containing protein (putative c-di-GMP-specific phosphodiesterase class I)/GGDEF domain-containing protein
MNDHSQPPSKPAQPHQYLPHNQLVDFLHHEIEKTGSTGVAVLIIELRQANRMDALTGNVSMHAIKNYTEQLLDTMLRAADRYTHFSGEQICLVLPGLASKDQAVLAANKIISEFQKPFTIGEYRVILRPHIGISNFPEFGCDAGQLLMFADIASRIAATDEKGYHVYRVEDHVETESYSGLDIELSEAIKNNELRVYYQPQIDISNERCVSAEALVRWTTSDNREINPLVLVNIAESCGLISPLTLLILNTALRHTAAFSALGIDIGISVNLPPRMLEDENLPQIIQQSLDIWGVPAMRLTLEITEGSIVKDLSSLTMLSNLREIGIKLAIDDFGTGYSSLAYLKKFPAQELKIDIIFVRNIHKSRGDKQLVRAIIDLAHNFDMITVAEGVEDQKTYDLLREMGCDVVQGFLFSQALTDQDFIGWYRQHHDEFVLGKM